MWRTKRHSEIMKKTQPHCIVTCYSTHEITHDYCQCRCCIRTKCHLCWLDVLLKNVLLKDVLMISCSLNVSAFQIVIKLFSSLWIVIKRELTTSDEMRRSNAEILGNFNWDRSPYYVMCINTVSLIFVRLFLFCRVTFSFFSLLLLSKICKSNIMKILWLLRKREQSKRCEHYSQEHQSKWGISYYRISLRHICFRNYNQPTGVLKFNRIYRFHVYR